MSDVFISYSRKDKVFARRLFDRLKQENYSSWADWIGIPYSAKWMDEIHAGIDQADNFVFIVSHDSLTSEICHLELEHALQKNKRIVPVVRREADPKALAGEWFGTSLEALARTNWEELKRLNFIFFRKRPGFVCNYDEITREVINPECDGDESDADDFEQSFQALLQTVQEDPEHKRRHTRYLLRGQEWKAADQREDYLLMGSEINEAERWLLNWRTRSQKRASQTPSLPPIRPEPLALHETYISASRNAETERTERLRNIRRASVIGTLAAVVAIVLAVGASLVGVQATSAANQANTQVVLGNAALNALHPSLTAADIELVQANATLRYVQDQGTQVAQQATSFSIEQARISTLAAGAVVMPPGTLTPELLLPTLTGIAQLRQWEPKTVIDKFGVEMVEVPSGCFIMGSAANGDEQPVSEHCFAKSFYIDRYEVTQAQFVQLSGVMQKQFQFQGELRPVDNIDWFEARDFCQLHRLGRLPTELEWEYAARGVDSFIYPWGNTLRPKAAVYNRSEFDGTEFVTTRDGEPERIEGASWVGAIDMAGNLWEWTSTRYDDLDPDADGIFLNLFSYPYNGGDGRELDETREEYQTRKSDTNVYTVRVLRGGSWYYDSNSLRSALRFWSRPDFGDVDIGFRCVSDNIP